jgi:membrane associated rhomboid family serine protease
LPGQLPVEKAQGRDYVHIGMLDDRYYMRRSSFDARRSATVLLIIVNVVAFVVQLILYSRFGARLTNSYGALSLEGLKQGYLWQILSFQFMHSGPWHLLCNCVVIYLFGRAVEEAVGRGAFLALYFLSGSIGGLLQALGGLVAPNLFGGLVIGSSAGGFGLTAAFAMLFPDQLILLFFILPLRAKYLLAFEGALAISGILWPPLMPGIAHAAHLGGILTGIFFVRYALHWQWHWPQFRRPRNQSPRRLIKVTSGTSALWNRTRAGAEDLPPEEFLSKEVDPILDKISAHGIQSLTERERRILEAAREKMAKR